MQLLAENLQTCEACRDALSKIKARLVDSVFQKVLENILYHKFCQKLPYEKSLVSFYMKIILLERLYSLVTKNGQLGIILYKIALIDGPSLHSVFFCIGFAIQN